MHRRNRYVLLALVPALCLGAAAHGIRAQGSSDTARSVSDSGITVVAEVFCSQVKLRTPSVRLRTFCGPQISFEISNPAANEFPS